MASRPSPRRCLVAVGVVGLLVGGIIVAGTVASEPSPCCSGAPYVGLYDRPLNRLDAVLARGDGQAFAAIAQDPLLQRPSVIANRGDFAYRAQRPVWGYAAWLVSLGQPDAVAWALALLTIVSCAAACVAGALLLRVRHVNAWWSLLIPLVALETLREFTPELLAFALLAGGLWCWQRDRHGAAMVVFCVAALTRETMLVGVAALALFTLCQTGSSQRSQVQSVLPLAAVLCAAGLLMRRDDVLTWVAAAFLGFALLLGPSVWLTNAGYARTLLPLFILGAIPVLGALHLRVGLPRARLGARLALNPGDAGRSAS